MHKISHTLSVKRIRIERSFVELPGVDLYSIVDFTQSGRSYQGVVYKISKYVRFLGVAVDDDIIKSPFSRGFLIDFHIKTGDKLTNCKGNKFYK